MPLYDYDCANCGHRFEVIHGVHVDGPTSCPVCGGGPVRKAISAPAIHFKGSGWAKKERRATATPGTSKVADQSSDSNGGSGGSSSDGGAGSDSGGDAGTGDTATAPVKTKSAKEAGTAASSGD